MRNWNCQNKRKNQESKSKSLRSSKRKSIGRIAIILAAIVIFTSLVHPGILSAYSLDTQTETENIANESGAKQTDKGQTVSESGAETDEEIVLSAADADKNDSKKSDKKEAADYPAQTFSDKTWNLTVEVSAPKGAFPADTRMKVKEIHTKKTLEQISDAVSGEVQKVCAADISFYDAKGKEIEPEKDVKVTMTPS